MEVWLVCKIIPHIVDPHLLAESAAGCSLIDRIVICVIQIAHIADRSNSLRCEESSQLQKVFCLLFLRFDGDQRGDQIACIFLQHTGRFPIFIPFDLAAWRIRGVAVDPGKFQRHAVDTANMCACPHDGYRRIAAAAVQIIAGGRALLKQSLLIVPPTLDPLSGSLVFSSFPDCVYEIFYGTDRRRHCRNLFLKISQHNRMHVSIYKSRDDTAVLKINHFDRPGKSVCIVCQSSRIAGRDILFPADPLDTSGGNGHAVGFRSQRIRCKYFTIFKYNCF